MSKRSRAGRAKPENRVQVLRLRAGSAATSRDLVAGEEPLEIRVLAGGRRETVAITMRTPGHDFELAAGFLFGEGVIDARERIRSIRYCTDVAEEQRYNVVNVTLRDRELPDLDRLERHFLVSSACGVCGKAHLDALAVRCDRPLPAGPRVQVGVLLGLPDAIRPAQRLFASTGGLHAAGLIAPDGTLLALREDVGRHNAMDKLIGWALLKQRSTEGGIVFVSGRASYELLQKAVAARMTVFGAASAPSSLAVELARRFGVTLVGFVRDGGLNVYANAERIEGLPVGA